MAIREEELISFFNAVLSEPSVPQEVIVPLELDIEGRRRSSPASDPAGQGLPQKSLDMASNNAKTNLLQKFEVMERQNETIEESMRELSEKLRIPGLSRIEIFDNSHISGPFTVAGRCSRIGLLC